MHRTASRLAPALLAALLLSATSCSSLRAVIADRPAQAEAVVPSFDRVVVVVLENHEFSQVIGNPSLPYFNALADAYGVATNYFAIAHPSLPNYIALTSGSTHRITSNCIACRIRGTNLIDQLELAGISWRAYMGSQPSPCYTQPSHHYYTKKTNPFAYYTDIVGDPARCANVVPIANLQTDIAAGELPSFVWITPDLCHSMHSCHAPLGDRYLSQLIPPLLDTLGDHGVLFLTWDEGATKRGCCRFAHGGRIATIVAGPDVRPGTRVSVHYDHYSLLRTIEESWGLPLMRNAACSCTSSMADMFHRS